MLDESNQSLIADLAHAIERQIVQRTWGRVHRLEVEVIDDRIVVHGYTQSYHSKQLVLEGARDVVGDSAHVELDVEVDPRCTVWRAWRQGRPPSAAG